MTPEQQFAEEVRANIDGLAADAPLIEASRQWVEKTSRHRYSYNFTWLGRPIIQYPQDIVALQEIIWRVRPDVIVETGIAHGGSLVLSASLLTLIDHCEPTAPSRSGSAPPRARRVIGIDIEIRPHNRQAIESHPLTSRIELIEGSSTEPRIVDRVRRAIADCRTVLVLLDSNHTRDHVLAELRAYAPLVTQGSYCVVFDTIIEYMPADLHANRPWGPGNGPLNAVRDYLAYLEGSHVTAADGGRLMFAPDHTIDDKLLVSVAPHGYLRRVER